MISDRDQQIRMLFLTQRVELASHGCVRQEIARVRTESYFSEYAVRHEFARVRNQRCETAISRQHDR